MSTVLIVDDDKGIVRLLSSVLACEGFDVEKAYSGEDGLSFFQHGESRPDLVLLDLSMPGMDGREFFQQVRARGFAGPVMFCSSWGAASANRELGGQGAIEKPFDPDVLVECVRGQLAQA
jgi:DNA-binding response OmpR family regulator